MSTQQPASFLQRQKAYVSKLDESNFKYGLAVGAAFVRGIRDIGYKHTGSALDELIDNAYEAGASNVHVVLNYDGSARKNNVTQIAVVDDGCGMISGMLRAAVLWGGTDRENSRTGIGRFGYGLPSASVSQGRRFEVYSAVDGGELFTCAIDLDDIEAGKYTDAKGEIVVPAATKAALPRFVQSYVEKHFPGGMPKTGTVVIIDKLDRLTWKSVNPLRDNLFKHFGVVYHKLRAHFEIVIDGTRVEPIDPLFLTPGYRWYDHDADRAKALDPLNIDVKDKDSGSLLGKITVRYAYMPMTFGSEDKKKKAVGKNANPRFDILKEYNGFIVSRMGRIIEVVRSSPLTTFVTNDAYIKVEIDFDAALDSEFNVPTTKQRVDVSRRIWDILEDGGVEKALAQLRKYRNEAQSELEAAEDAPDGGKRRSERAMEEVAKLASVTPLPTAEKRAEQAELRLQQAAERRARERNKPVVEARRELEAEFGGGPYKVAFDSVPGGTFFRVEQLGGTKVLFINKTSKFFTEVHSGPSSTPAVRAALEVLLFGIGDRALDSREEVQAFYAHEIVEWSRKLELALTRMGQDLSAASNEDTPAAATA